MINITDKAKCTGCGACVNVCPRNAISFERDFAGYNYPKVNAEKCVDCSLCERVCPVINPVKRIESFKEPFVKAAWNLDEAVRINSTSGGIFTALALSLIEEGGFVAGAEYAEDFTVRHTVVSTAEGIERLRQSKYAQSETEGIFPHIKELLSEGKKVMFCGSPCQTAGLISFLKKDFENLLTVDFICRGIISDGIYKNYLESVERHNCAKVANVQFRNKESGWNGYTVKISLANGEKYQHDREHDEYMVGYLKHNLYLRPCCHECAFKTLPRVSDISLGDFWGIGNSKRELDDNKGTSVVLINTPRGREAFAAVAKNSVYSEDSTIEQVTKGNACLLNAPEKGKYSDYFYKNFRKTDFIDLIHRIEKKALWDRQDLTVRDRLYLIKKRFLKG